MEKELFGDIAADGGGAEDGETLHQFQNLTGHKIYTQHLGTLHALHMSSYFGCRQPTETTATPAAEIPVLEDENLHQFQNLTGHKIYSQHLGILHDLHMSSYFGCRQTAEPAAAPAAEIPVSEDQNLHRIRIQSGPTSEHLHLSISASGVFVNIFYVVAGQGVATVRL